jgi:adenylyltransferase/sulfurtransferase
MARATEPLTPTERQRYSRHLILNGVGTRGQEALKAARVLLVGVGGLGSPCALYLAAAGVGTLGLVDQDTVDVSNLQRQVLHGTAQIGKPKLESAAERLRDLNPHVRIARHDAWLTAANALEIVGAYDVVVDGADNFATRYLVNDACVLTGRPNVHASVFQFDGQASVFCTADGPCYRCLYPEPPPPGLVQNCAEGGVMGVLPGLLGMIQATETLKLLLNLGDSLSGRLLMVDALSMQFHTITLARDPNCPACGTRTLTTLIDYDQFCGTPPLGRAPSEQVAEISPAALRARLQTGAPLQLIDVRELSELRDGAIDGSRLIPLGTLAERLPELDRQMDVVVVCRSGKRSTEAARQLMAAGFGRVQSLAGGMLAWQERG